MSLNKEFERNLNSLVKSCSDIQKNGVGLFEISSPSTKAITN